MFYYTVIWTSNVFYAVEGITMFLTWGQFDTMTIGVLGTIRYETNNTLSSKMIMLTLRQCCKLYIWVLKHIAFTYCLSFSPQMSGTWYLGILPSLVLVCFLWFSTSSSWFSITASTESQWTMKYFQSSKMNNACMFIEVK